MLATSTYIQKSHLLLYPLLGLTAKTLYKPNNTYIGYKGIDIKDRKLICVYETEPTEEFYKFRNEVLKSNPYYESIIITLDKNIIIFDMSDFTEDWDHFLNGKYSKFSETSKKLIKQFYSLNPKAASIIDSHIYPEDFHEIYADLFEVSVEVIQNNFETLTPPDLEKEVL